MTTMKRKKGGLEYERSQDEEMVFAEESALAHAALVIADALEAAGISQKELAERIKVSESRVSQILGASNNLTVRTMARMAKALKRRIRVEFAPDPAIESSSDDAQPWVRPTMKIVGKWQAQNDEASAERSGDLTEPCAA